MKKIVKLVQLIILSILCCTGCDKKSQALAGYIEGEYTYIASGVSGTLLQLNVVRGQTVKQGELLYSLDLEPEQASVNVIKANIEEQKAQIIFAKSQLLRQKKLILTNATAQSNLDQAQSDYDAKVQGLAADQAQLIQNEWALKQKTVIAPTSGIIFDTFFRVGEKVPLNQPVLAILVPTNIRVLFYVPEEQLSQIKLGQKIKFSCDSCQSSTTASISYISPEAEYTPPVIYSKDTRYKLVYRVKADMPANIAVHFHPGQPVDVSLHD